MNSNGRRVESAFLLTRIKFKPPIIEQLAREAGIDPAAIDFLRKHGITNIEELISRFNFGESPDEDNQTDSPEEPVSTGNGDVYGDARDLYGEDTPDIPPRT